jgi:hypothetical protein
MEMTFRNFLIFVLGGVGGWCGAVSGITHSNVLMLDFVVGAILFAGLAEWLCWRARKAN